MLRLLTEDFPINDQDILDLFNENIGDFYYEEYLVPDVNNCIIKIKILNQIIPTLIVSNIKYYNVNEFFKAKNKSINYYHFFKYLKENEDYYKYSDYKIINESQLNNNLEIIKKTVNENKEYSKRENYCVIKKYFIKLISKHFYDDLYESLTETINENNNNNYTLNLNYLKNYSEVSESVKKKKINLLFKDIKKVIPNDFDNLMDTYLTYGDGANRVYDYLKSGNAMKKVTKIIKKSLIQAPSKELIAYIMLSNNISYGVITYIKKSKTFNIFLIIYSLPTLSSSSGFLLRNVSVSSPFVVTLFFPFCTFSSFF